MSQYISSLRSARILPRYRGNRKRQRKWARTLYPGYGFLAENLFLRKGWKKSHIHRPSPDVLRLLGDKILARDAMVKSGIPVARGRTARCVQRRRHRNAEIGYPVIIKASAGGGIGMQVVESPADFDKALRICQGRAKSAFGDDRVFSRNSFGSTTHRISSNWNGERAIHLGERFCSIQRRHQKDSGRRALAVRKSGLTWLQSS